MDTKFQEMLVEAEKIRRRIDQNRFIGQHALLIRNIKKYAKEHDLFEGNLQENTANEDLLNFHAEIAACRVETIKGKRVSSIFLLNRKEKLDLINCTL